jgi:hypothetical protein
MIFGDFRCSQPTVSARFPSKFLCTKRHTFAAKQCPFCFCVQKTQNLPVGTALQTYFFFLRVRRILRYVVGLVIARAQILTRPKLLSTCFISIVSMLCQSSIVSSCIISLKNSVIGLKHVLFLSKSFSMAHVFLCPVAASKSSDRARSSSLS